MKLSSVKRLTITAVCIALCYVLPMAFHAVGAGSVFAPMHIPVLLCGLLCGGAHGLFCGAAGALLSSALSSMPPAAALPYMLPELMTYGLVAGLAAEHIRTGKLFADLYICLAAAMILGRVVGGIAQALVYMGSGEAFGLSVWVSSYFVVSAPGILCHLIVVPLLTATLMKARLVPARYPKV